ncbi:hypothetical protein [Ferrimonas balearica]|uniref:hypothetical protein n=1 Tax=Ferrimonas balearica TaxID=44012 RepID=UPI001C9843D6|nr:hypothetical protein [Ferrimonas balearica]MBY6223582.1 hypothetical protein [Ferrimonas balearica]
MSRPTTEPKDVISPDSEPTQNKEQKQEKVERIWHDRTFQCAIGIPIVLFLALVWYVSHGDNLTLAGMDGGSAALALFGDRFKWPLAVLALAFPFGAWAIADKRNRDTQEALKRQSLALEKQERALQHQLTVFEAQEEKRIQDLYYAKAKYSVDMLCHYVEQMPNGHYFSEGSLTLLFENLFGKPNVRGLWPLSANEVA